MEFNGQEASATAWNAYGHPSAPWPAMPGPGLSHSGRSTAPLPSQRSSLGRFNGTLGELQAGQRTPKHLAKRSFPTLNNLGELTEGQVLDALLPLLREIGTVYGAENREEGQCAHGVRAAEIAEPYRPFFAEADGARVDLIVKFHPHIPRPSGVPEYMAIEVKGTDRTFADVAKHALQAVWYSKMLFEGISAPIPVVCCPGLPDGEGQWDEGTHFLRRAAGPWSVGELDIASDGLLMKFTADTAMSGGKWRMGFKTRLDARFKRR